MSVEEILGLLIALLIMGVGVAGSVLPGLPSTPLVLIGAVAHKLYFLERGASTWVLLVMGGLVALSIVVDLLATAWGANRMGATWRGVCGAVIGAVVGLFFSLPGIVLGPFVGATLFEMAGKRPPKESAKAGAGAVMGLMAGVVGKVACCLLMITLFAVNVIVRTMAAR